MKIEVNDEYKRGPSRARVSIKERFENFVMPEPNTGCWIWMGSCSIGYGWISYRGKNLKAHRVSYALYKGEFPDHLVACHTCDNSYCVNPDHIFLGTLKDNSQDMVKKGRHRSVRGEDSTMAKLSNKIVLEIMRLKNEGVSRKKIAIQLGTTVSRVNHVVYGGSWGHITGVKNKYPNSKYKKSES